MNSIIKNEKKKNLTKLYYIMKLSFKFSKL